MMLYLHWCFWYMYLFRETIGGNLWTVNTHEKLHKLFTNGIENDQMVMFLGLQQKPVSMLHVLIFFSRNLISITIVFHNTVLMISLAN